MILKKILVKFLVFFVNGSVQLSHTVPRMSLMITWPAYCWQDQPSYQSYHLQNSILILFVLQKKDPYCILLLSLIPVDATQKKDDEIWLIGSWDLGVLFQKVLSAGHNAGQGIIKIYRESFKKCSKEDFPWFY